MKKKLVTVELFFYCDPEVKGHDVMQHVADSHDLLGQGGHELAKGISFLYGDAKFSGMSYDEKTIEEQDQALARLGLRR